MKLECSSFESRDKNLGYVFTKFEFEKDVFKQFLKEVQKRLLQKFYILGISLI